MNRIFRERKHKRRIGRTQEAFHLLGQMLKFHPGAVVITDAAGTIGAASARFVRWFPQTEPSIPTRTTVLDALAPEDAHNYRNILSYVCRQDKIVRDFELSTTVPDTDRRLRLTVVPLRDSQNAAVGLLHLFEGSEAGPGLDGDLDRVEKLTNMGQIAAGMAHELNTPLGSIILSADILRDSALPDQVLTEVKKIKQQATHCSEVVRRLLDYVRSDDHEREDHEIAAIIRKVMSLVEVEARKHDIVLALDVASTQDRVRCDENQMEQLFFNLFSNSLHAVGRNGRIGVQIMDDALLNQVRVTFSDNGCGIPAEHLGRVFEPFFTTKSRAEGTGLGLALCRKIVAEHGGRIDVKSTVGEGTTFTLSFPVAR